MSLFTPSRRWQPAFYPFKKQSFSAFLTRKIELMIKGPLFGCRMCGNCLLQETAFICPMECSKGLRNGPCGGITPEKMCYVDETRKCIWYAIYKRSEKLGREKMLLEILPPLDWEKAGTDTWAEVAKQIHKVGTFRFMTSILSKNAEVKTRTWDSVFKTIRQPDWWRGDADYHPKLTKEPASSLEHSLMKGEFIVATELTPPLSSKADKLVSDIELVKPFVKAVNYTDSSSARPKMSSLACSRISFEHGVEPIFQIAARDATRTALQSTAVGLNPLGIHNILCISGDSPVIGPSPVSNMNILDIDSIQMLWILRRMRDEGIYLDGRRMKTPPKFFLGAAVSPLSMDPKLQVLRDKKKVNAGAQFFQTNLIFEPDKLDKWLENLYKEDILDKVYILIGIAPLKSLKVAEYLHYKVPGVSLPAEILKRMTNAGAGSEEEGVQIALETIEKVKTKRGINGIHLMSLGWEAILPRLVSESGLSHQK